MKVKLDFVHWSRHHLPWSAYDRLLSVRNESARKFYETEALRSGRTVRQLDRQMIYSIPSCDGIV